MLALAVCVACTSPATAGRVADCNHVTDPERVIRGCTRIIESGEWSGPSLAWAHIERGAAFLESGDAAAALPDYDRALVLDPASTRAWVGKAWALLDLGRPVDAIEAAGNGFAAPDGSSHASLYEVRAKALLALGRNDEALQAFREMLRYGPDAFRRYQEELAALGYWSEPVVGIEAMFAPHDPDFFPNLIDRIHAALERCIADGCELP